MKKSHLRIPLSLLAILSFVLLSGFEGGGCGEGLDNRPGQPGIDVGGVQGAEWKLDYSNQVFVRVKNASGVVADYTLSRVAGGSFSLDGEVIDLQKMCAREDVRCPDEFFPGSVVMRQPGWENHVTYVDFHRPGPDGVPVKHTLIGNVDSDMEMSVALGVGLGGAGPCALLSVSYFNGHIDPSPADSTIGLGLHGDIVTAYSGSCLLAGKYGAAAGNLTVELRMPVHGDRIMQ